MPAQLEIYDLNDPTNKLDIIPTATDIKFLEDLGDTGGGSFELHNDDPRKQDPALLQDRNVVKLRIDGKVSAAMILQKNTPTMVSANEYSGTTTTYAGNGLLDWLRDASVRPYGGVRLAAYDNRAFNFASELGDWYNPSDWSAPVVISPWGDQPTNPWRYAPAQWPDAPSANWIWSTAVPSPPAGLNFFRYDFSTSSFGKYSFFAAADDIYEIYVDGQLVSNASSGVENWSETQRVDFELEAGAHVIGVKVSNISGRGGFIGAFFRAGDPSTQDPAALISVTNTTDWKVCGYPAQQPGWTPGEVLLTLLSEAQSRGVKFPTFITPTFTNTLDSKGNAWKRDVDWTFQVGESYLSVVKKLQELACDVWIDPDTLELNAAINRGTDRSDVNSETIDAVIFTKGHNLTSAIEKGESDIKNSLLVNTNAGMIEVQDADSIAKYGVIEDVLDVAADVALSTTIADKVLETSSKSVEGATYKIIPREGVVPNEDFFVGDWVLAPGSDGPKTRRRVSSISVELDKNTGVPVYNVEFDTIFLDRQANLERWMSNTISGSMGGTVSTATPGATTGSPSTGPSSGGTLTKVPSTPTFSGITNEGLGYWDAGGNPKASMVFNWSSVTTYTDGSAAVIPRYEVWVHKSGQSALTSTSLGFSTGNTTTITEFDSGTSYVFNLYAVSKDGVFSAPSASVTRTAAYPTQTMSAPSDPTITSKGGTVTVTWDGLMGGSQPPPQFDHVQPQYSSSSSGPFNGRGNPIARRGGTSVLTDLEVGSVAYVRLVAYDSLGNVTPASGVVNVTVVGVAMSDADSDIILAIENAQSAADDANDAALAAAGIANSKGKIIIQNAAPATADRLPQNLWIDTTGGNNTPKQWTGSAWVEVTDKAAKDAAQAAVNAHNAAVAAQSTADGKNTIFLSVLSSPPVGKAGGDLWYVRGTGADADRIIGVRMYNGTSWEPYQLVADSVLVPSSIGNTLIKDGAVTTPKLEAKAVTADKIDFGAAEGEAIFVGGRVPQGEAQQRVPAPLNDTVYWNGVRSGDIPFDNPISFNAAVAFTANGWTIPNNANNVGPLTPILPIPQSRRVYTSYNTTSTNMSSIVWLAANKTTVVQTDPVTATDTAYEAPSSAVYYYVRLRQPAADISYTFNEFKKNYFTNPSFELGLSQVTRMISGGTFSWGTSGLYGSRKLDLTVNSQANNWIQFYPNSQLNIQVDEPYAVYIFSAYFMSLSPNVLTGQMRIDAGNNRSRIAGSQVLGIPVANATPGTWYRVAAAVAAPISYTPQHTINYIGGELSINCNAAARFAYWDGILVEKATPDQLTFSGTNMVPNPSAETDLSNTQVQSGIVLTRSNEWSSVGSWSFKMVGNGNAGSSYFTLGGDGTAMRMGLTAGKTYRLKATIRVATVFSGTNENFRACLTIFTASATEDLGRWRTPEIPNVVGTYDVEMVFNINSSATRASLMVLLGADVGTMYVDNIVINELIGINPTPYFDGDNLPTIPGKELSVSWDGAPNASSSTLIEKITHTTPASGGTLSSYTVFEAIGESATERVEIVPSGVSAFGSDGRTVMTSRGIEVFNSSNQTLLRLGHDVPTGLTIRNPSTSQMVPLAEAAFAQKMISKIDVSPAYTLGTTTWQWTQFGIDSDFYIDYVAWNNSAEIRWGQTWAVNYPGSLVPVTAYIRPLIDGSPILSSNGAAPSQGVENVNILASPVESRSINLSGGVTIPTIPGQTYRISLQWCMWRASFAPSTTATLANRFIAVSPTTE